MKLTVSERINLINILPIHANFVVLTKSRELSNQLNFSDEEIKNWEIKAEDNQVKWNPEKVQSKDIKIGEIMTEEIKRILREKDEAKELELPLLTLYEKFINTKE